MVKRNPKKIGTCLLIAGVLFFASGPIMIYDSINRSHSFDAETYAGLIISFIGPIVPFIGLYYLDKAERERRIIRNPISCPRCGTVIAMNDRLCSNCEYELNPPSVGNALFTAYTGAFLVEITRREFEILLLFVSVAIFSVPLLLYISLPNTLTGTILAAAITIIIAVLCIVHLSLHARKARI